MGKLKWEGAYQNIAAGPFRVFLSSGAWTLQRDGKRVSRHDSRDGAKRKAAKTPAKSEVRSKAARHRFRPAKPQTALSLGPSNDAPAAVLVEILAAEVGQNPEVWRRFMDNDPRIDGDLRRICARSTLTLGAMSPDAGHAYLDPPPRWTIGELRDYWSGWLAREIAIGDAADDTPIRHGAPEVIGLTPRQVQAQMVDEVATEDELRDPEVTARNAAQAERAAIAGAAAKRHADLPATYATGRWPTDADQLPLPVVSAPVLPPLTPAEEHAHGVMEIADRERDACPVEVDDMLAAEGLVRFEIVTDDGARAAGHDNADADEADFMTQSAADRIEVARRLRAARGLADLGLGQAARKLEIPSAELDDIEHGREAVSADDLATMAKVYGVSLAWLQSGDGRPRKEADDLPMLAPPDAEIVDGRVVAHGGDS